MSNYFLQTFCSICNSSLLMTLYIGVSLSSCFLSLFLSIYNRFSFAFFQTFFNKVLHVKFLISHCVGVPPELLVGPLMGPYQDLGGILIENGISRGVCWLYHYHWGSHTWSLMQLLIFPLCDDLLWILNGNSWPKWTFSTLTSVCVFSIMFSIHFPRCWEGEFVWQSKAS